MPQRILRLPDVQAQTGLSRTQVYTLVGKRQFPQPVKISLRAIGFLASEVDEWIIARAAERT